MKVSKNQHHILLEVDDFEASMIMLLINEALMGPNSFTADDWDRVGDDADSQMNAMADQIYDVLPDTREE